MAVRANKTMPWQRLGLQPSKRERLHRSQFAERPRLVAFLTGTIQFFLHTLHIPAPLVAVAFLVKFLGGIAVLVGHPHGWLERWFTVLSGYIRREIQEIN